jgi:hypothetical protein
VSDATNCVEQMGVVLIVERRATRDRYFCTKCNLLFWGSIDRVKHHLRGSAPHLVSACKTDLTSAEEEVLSAHDEGREGDADVLAQSLASKRKIMRLIASTRCTKRDGKDTSAVSAAAGMSAVSAAAGVPGGALTSTQTSTDAVIDASRAISDSHSHSPDVPCAADDGIRPDGI